MGVTAVHPYQYNTHSGYEYLYSTIYQLRIKEINIISTYANTVT
jgi:hypothetical protein